MINNEKKLVSVVMLSYNRKDDVAEGLGELLNHDYEPLEIIVVDNASSDQTAEMIGQQFPTVNVIALEKNIGVDAYNHGFRQANGEYIVILDDDSFPAKHAIPRMVEKFENDPQLGVVAFDVRNYYEYKENYAEKQTGNHHHPKEPGQQTGQQTQDAPPARYQMAFNGAGVGIRKKCIDEVGGYPGEFFLYWNEQDLSIRILDAGYKIQWFTGIVSLHKYSPANRESWRAPFFYTRNLFWLIWKHFYFSRMVKDTARLIYYTIYYSFQQKTTIYLKAAFSALFNIRKIRRKPVKKKIIQDLRLTYRLAFIYYK